MNIRRFVLALLLSFVITPALAVGYGFAPIIVALAKSWSAGPGTAGIAVVVGGASTSKWSLLLTESIVFAILLFILSRRRTT